MPPPSAEPGPHDPRSEAARIARTLARRLEDQGRAGRAVVPHAQTPPDHAPGARAPAPKATPSARDASPPPESRAARAMKDDLARHAATPDAAPIDPEAQDLFDFGAPDLENGSTRADALRRIADEVAACEQCPLLVANRSRTVPGAGDPNSGLVFVGEGPGAEEDRQGLPFVGRAGELLTKMIESIDLARDQVFIANIVKCRPPENRAPMPDEVANCLPYLLRQLEIIRPRVVCALGGVAAKTLLQTTTGITRLRGRFHPWRGMKLMPTFHPAYLLRNYTTETRKAVYEDLLAIKAEL